MGVDLHLTVERSQGGKFYRVLRSYHLFQQLCQSDFGERSRHVYVPKLITDEIAKDFDNLEEEDGYGGKLHYITAGETTGVKLDWESEDTHQMLEDFKRMPPETKIAMFWC
jgi:hypothetical protein